MTVTSKIYYYCLHFQNKRAELSKVMTESSFEDTAIF